MRRILTTAILAAMLAGCTGSPNYHRPYTPIRATMNHSRASGVQKSVIAITDAGREVETSDATTGIVLTKWFSGDGLFQDQSRYRIRVVFDEANGYEIVSMCQHKSGSAWGDEGCGSDIRPQFVLDVMATIEGALK